MLLKVTSGKKVSFLWQVGSLFYGKANKAKKKRASTSTESPQVLLERSTL